MLHLLLFESVLIHIYFYNIVFIQNLDDAKKFFEKKNSFLKDNLSKLQKSIISRQDQNKGNI